MNTFLFRHVVDWSLLTDGFHIQTEMHKLVYALPGGALSHGEHRQIRILLEGEEFRVNLNNIGFSRSVYPDHPDLLQVRYTEKSAIARKLQAIFYDDYQYLKAAKALAKPRQHLSLPKDNLDEIVFYGTPLPDVYVMECLRSAERAEAANDVLRMEELDFETFEVRDDPDATIKEVTRLQRVRQLDRSIGDSLKQLYDYHCQMTGEMIGDPYGVHAVEAHHIIPFTESMNNDMSNLIILSPNYHRIVHQAHPTFDREKLAFIFPNGLEEKVKLNLHLR